MICSKCKRVSRVPGGCGRWTGNEQDAHECDIAAAAFLRGVAARLVDESVFFVLKVVGRDRYLAADGLTTSEPIKEMTQTFPSLYSAESFMESSTWRSHESYEVCKVSVKVERAGNHNR